MMRHPEHHVPATAMQRNSRINMPQMPQPTQRMLMTVPGAPHSGVLVSMPGPTLITTTAVAPIQQQHPEQQPKTNSVPVYYDNHSHNMNNDEQPDMNQEQQQPAQQPQQPQVTNTTTSSTVPNLTNIKEKTPMCLVNELARYNKIQHQYRLTGETGPAHKKIFTVTLKLDNEEYEAEGPSIKKAQHSAAAQALAKTQLKHPPPKSTRNNRPGMRGGGSGMVTPTVELNALAMKRGERTVYIVENGPPHHPQPYMAQPGNYYPRHNIFNPQGQPRYNCDIRRGHQMRGHYGQYDNRYYNHFKPGFQHTNGEQCTVLLRIADREYSGTGLTVQAARHDAAAKAIDDIKRLNVEEGRNEEPPHVEPPVENGATEVNTELKSPISLVHEIALKRHLNVVFEVLSEKGPPHMKVFVTQCKIGETVVEGEGNGKKKSKKRAAEKMLEQLAKFPPLPNMTNNTQLKKKRVANKKKTRNLIKVNADKSTEYTEEINPISRLIQIQQANKEKEPDYTVIEERGAPRRREFVIQASVNGVACNGVGPNKKIAKRSAAQALLNALGYGNPNSTTPAKPNNIINKIEKEAAENVEKPRKVTFLEEKQDPPVGGSCGRQLVPGLLLVGDQSVTMQKPKSINDNAGTPNGTEKKAMNKVAPPPPQGVQSKDKLLYLAQLMNIHVQFSDFPKANHEQYLTLVSLNTNPPQVCHGEGPTTEASHEKASLEALNVLSELGLDTIAPCKDNSNDGVNKHQVTAKTSLAQNGGKK
ncbi:Double-stranded RNA binding motif [Popillia japonica]|uniref:Double-stranded RNA binding motif n=1 Tax=Popillia japonica TaxID=7064 RepID=A0AAW1KIL5_POPJA